MATSARPRTSTRSLYAGWGLFLVLAALPPLFFVDSEYFSVLTIAGIFAITAVSLDLLLGYAGQLSLGQAALFGVSAYVTAYLTVTKGWSPEPAALAAIAATMLVALLTSPILRLQGFYFALATLSVTLIAETIMRNWIDVTGGSSGFLGIGRLSFFGTEITSDTAYYVVVWSVLAVVVLLGLQLGRSRFGRALLAVHEDEIAAQAMGVPVRSVKIRVWLLAAAFSGISGVLYAFYLRFISPSQFGLLPTIMLIIMVVIGGTGTIYGAVIGSIFVRVLPVLFAGFEEYSPLIYGIAIIVFTIMFPGGIYGAVRDLIQRLRKGRSGDTASATAVEKVPATAGSRAA
jgi:branched-chain amino acid transport system permease protein